MGGIEAAGVDGTDYRYNPYDWQAPASGPSFTLGRFFDRLGATWRGARPDGRNGWFWVLLRLQGPIRRCAVAARGMEAVIVRIDMHKLALRSFRFRSKRC